MDRVVSASRSRRSENHSSLVWRICSGKPLPPSVKIPLEEQPDAFLPDPESRMASFRPARQALSPGQIWSRSVLASRTDEDIERLPEGLWNEDPVAAREFESCEPDAEAQAQEEELPCEEETCEEEETGEDVNPISAAVAPPFVTSYRRPVEAANAVWPGDLGSVAGQLPVDTSEPRGHGLAVPLLVLGLVATLAAIALVLRTQASIEGAREGMAWAKSVMQTEFKAARAQVEGCRADLEAFLQEQITPAAAALGQTVRLAKAASERFAARVAMELADVAEGLASRLSDKSSAVPAKDGSATARSVPVASAAFRE